MLTIATEHENGHEPPPARQREETFLTAVHDVPLWVDIAEPGLEKRRGVRCVIHPADSHGLKPIMNDVNPTSDGMPECLDVYDKTFEVLGL
jgi:hypothetical protein